MPLLAMRRTVNGSGQGRWRRVVERTFAWLSQFRRLRVRYDQSRRMAREWPEPIAGCIGTKRRRRRRCRHGRAPEGRLRSFVRSFPSRGEASACATPTETRSVRTSPSSLKRRRGNLRVDPWNRRRVLGRYDLDSSDTHGTHQGGANDRRNEAAGRVSGRHDVHLGGPARIGPRH
jgi:hypothetical protein